MRSGFPFRPEAVIGISGIADNRRNPVNLLIDRIYPPEVFCPALADGPRPLASPSCKSPARSMVVRPAGVPRACQP
jgi:hypothetical protein